MAVPCCSIHPSAYAVKKGEKVATSQFPTHRGHGFFSATRGLSKLSCDTARRRGAPALSSLVAHNLGFLEAPSSSSSSPPTSFSVLSLFFLENKTGNKERKRSNKSNWDSRLELLRGYVREPTAPTIVTRRPRPAFGEMWNFQCFIIMGLHTFISFFSSPDPRKRQSEWLCILRSVLTPNVVAFKNRSSIIQIYIFVYIMLLQFSYGNEREL